MRIDCVKYEWSVSSIADTLDVNFYSNVAPTELETVDLFEYYIDDTMSDVEYSFESADNTGTLYTETSNFEFNCINDNLISDTLLIDFFECYNTTKYLKWKINLYDDDNVLIYTGILYKDGIQISNVEDKVLSLNIVGYEKEFKDYFANKKLVEDTAFPPTPDVYTGMFWYSLSNVLNQNFPNVTIENSLGFYKMLQWGYTVSPALSTNQMVGIDIFHVKCGYRNFADAGVSRFDFFNGLIMSMGWAWYFYLGKLYMKNRYDLTLDTITLDADLFISHSLTNSLQDKADAVVIDDGDYYGNIGVLGGDRAMYYSENIPYYNVERPFRTITYAYVSSEHRYTLIYNSWTFSRIEDEDIKRLRAIKFTIGTGGDPTVPPVSSEYYEYPGWRYFRLNPVINPRDYSSGLDTRNARANPPGAYIGNGNFISIANRPETNSQFFYNGNPGNCLLKSVGGTRWMGYEYYCDTPEFKDNFKTLLRSAISVNMIVETNEYMTNPFYNFDIANYNDAVIDSKLFFISKFSFHPINLTTSLNIQTIQ